MVSQLSNLGISGARWMIELLQRVLKHLRWHFIQRLWGLAA
jgi:hypothetical protein